MYAQTSTIESRANRQTLLDLIGWIEAPVDFMHNSVMIGRGFDYYREHRPDRSPV